MIGDWQSLARVVTNIGALIQYLLEADNLIWYRFPQCNLAGAEKVVGSACVSVHHHDTVVMNPVLRVQCCACVCVCQSTDVCLCLDTAVVAYMCTPTHIHFHTSTYTPPAHLHTYTSTPPPSTPSHIHFHTSTYTPPAHLHTSTYTPPAHFHTYTSTPPHTHASIHPHPHIVTHARYVHDKYTLNMICRVVVMVCVKVNCRYVSQTGPVTIAEQIEKEKKN